MPAAVLMPDRKDAFCAAAEIVLAIETSALATGAVDTCATVGKCNILSRSGKQYCQPGGDGW